jgi:hypothetical protein
MLVAFAGCGGGAATGPQASLVAARNRWVQNAPTSYSMVISVSCECLPGTGDPARITVRNGVVESRRYVATGADVPPERASGYRTVPELFEMIDEAERQGVKPIDVQYAPLGYPTRIALGDPAVDAPVTFITDFHPL